MRVKNYKQQVVNRYKKAFKQTAIAFNNANQDAINLPSYWAGFEDSTTHRQNGEVVVGAYRDIFDLGNVSTSQNMSVKGIGTVVYTWDGNNQTPVAQVYFGSVNEYGYIPGRRWTDRALQLVDLGQVFQNNF